MSKLRKCIYLDNKKLQTPNKQNRVMINHNIDLVFVNRRR